MPTVGYPKYDLTLFFHRNCIAVFDQSFSVRGKREGFYLSQLADKKS